MISKSQEEYLKTMYILQMHNGEIRVSTDRVIGYDYK